MNILRLLWVFGVCFVVECHVNFWQANSDLVLSVADYFNVVFCVFEQNERQKDLELISAKIHPSKKRLFTSFLNFSQISDFLRDDINISKPIGKTMIILGMNNGTLKGLSELSQTRSISSVVWVMFSNRPLESESFQRIYIPFDCEFVYINQIGFSFSITEIYRIGKSSELEIYNLGHWSKENGLSVVDLNLYTRRNNLRGHRLKAAIKNNPPYVSIEEDSEGELRLKGYLYEIWNELESRINFRTEFSEKYFDKDPLEVLRNDEVDFAVARIPNEPSALQYMDFSQPIDEAKCDNLTMTLNFVRPRQKVTLLTPENIFHFAAQMQICFLPLSLFSFIYLLLRFYMFGHRPGSELDWDSYLKPFSANTWLVNFLWMLSSSLALSVLYKIAWDYGTSEREPGYFIFTFSESLLTVFRALCMQGSDVTPRSNACRLLFLSIYLTALVVTSAFSAALFSLLTIPKPRVPFNSLDQVLSNRRYRIGLPSESQFHKIIEDFSSTLPSPKKRKMLEIVMESKTKAPLTSMEGLQRVCHDETYVFIFDLPNVLYLMQNLSKSCQDKILPSGSALFTEYIGFGYKKNNPYKKLINFHLLRMKNEGILHRLLLNYWPPRIPTVQATWVRVTVSDISPILFMFAFGALLGTIILYVEKLIMRIRKRNTNINSLTVNNNIKFTTQMNLYGFPKNEKTSKWEMFLYSSDKKPEREPQ